MSSYGKSLSREGWSDATCEGGAQLSLLVALSMPPGGAGLQFFDRGGGAWRARHVPHAPGRAILLECSRPHSLLPFAAADAGSTAPRIVLHAFLLPCRAGVDGPLEYQVVGSGASRVMQRN